VILGFQGRSQLEARYGEDTDAMLSQPGTKIFLKTSEPRAARWVSEAIGEIEIGISSAMRGEAARSRLQCASLVKYSSGQLP